MLVTDYLGVTRMAECRGRGVVSKNISIRKCRECDTSSSPDTTIFGENGAKTKRSRLLEIFKHRHS